MPFAAGRNVFTIVQLLPAASDIPTMHVPPRVNSPAFVPVVAKPLIDSAPAPLLFSVTLFILVLPTFTAPKLTEAALSVAMPPVTGGESDAADCVTMNVAPLAVTFALRMAPVLAATTYVTVPFPFPLPDAVNQVAPLLALHVHPAAADTLSVADPPLAATVALVGLIA